jgi:hypothetical protein
VVVWGDGPGWGGGLSELEFGAVPVAWAWAWRLSLSDSASGWILVQKPMKRKGCCMYGSEGVTGLQSRH